MRMLSEDVRGDRTVLSPATPEDDPLLRLQAETQTSGEVHLRCTTHPEEITITGITVVAHRQSHPGAFCRLDTVEAISTPGRRGANHAAGLVR
jgi:hypothetical protein